MAYIRRRNTELNNGNPVNNGNPMLNEQAGIVGQNADIPGRPESTSGKSTGWYNVQELLNANQQSPYIKNRIEDKGRQAIDAGKNQLNAFTTPELPTATGFDKNRVENLFNAGMNDQDENDIYGFLNQQYGANANYAKSANELFPGASDSKEINGIIPGDFKSLMSWFGNTQKQDSNYTPGMKKVDEMFLRGQGNFANEYPAQLQDEYRREVTEPIEQKRQQYTEQQGQAKQGIADANRQWFQGITDLLGDKDKLIDGKLGTQKGEIEKANSTYNPDKFFTPEMLSKLHTPLNTPESRRVTPKPGTASVPEFFDLSPYVKRTGEGNASTSTAARDVLGQTGIDAYNTLAPLINLNKSYGSDEFKLPSYSADADRAKTDFMSKWKSNEEQKILDTIESLNRDQKRYIMYNPNEERPAPESHDYNYYTISPDNSARMYLDEPNEGTRYYDIPDKFDSPFGKIDNTLPQKGKRHYAPYEYLPTEDEYYYKRKGGK